MFTMCAGYKYRGYHPETGEAVEKTVYFPRPYAEIPFLPDLKDIETIAYGRWGVREKDTDAPPDIPQTGWAKQETLGKGYWEKYGAIKTLVPIRAWMEKDPQRESHWFDMSPNTYLAAMRIERDGVNYVYIVTRSPEAWFAPIHNRQPLIVKWPKAA